MDGENVENENDEMTRVEWGGREEHWLAADEINCELYAKDRMMHIEMSIWWFERGTSFWSVQSDNWWEASAAKLCGCENLVYNYRQLIYCIKYVHSRQV